jgi:hypothetical protein
MSPETPQWIQEIVDRIKEPKSETTTPLETFIEPCSGKECGWKKIKTEKLERGIIITKWDTGPYIIEQIIQDSRLIKLNILQEKIITFWRD